MLSRSTSFPHSLLKRGSYKAIRPGKSRCWICQSRCLCPFNPEAIKIPTLPPGVDEGGVSEEDLDGDLHNERQGDDPSVDRAGDNDRSGEDASMLEESHFTSEQIELFQCRYENGYDLYTDTDYVTWLMDNHPEDVPDEILGEIGSELDQA